MLDAEESESDRKLEMQDTTQTFEESLTDRSDCWNTEILVQGMTWASSITARSRQLVAFM